MIIIGRNEGAAVTIKAAEDRGAKGRERATSRWISMGFVWKRIRPAEWTGRDGASTYTIRQSGGAKFYVTRAIEHAPFATLRSLALAKAMAEEDASDRASGLNLSRHANT